MDTMQIIDKFGLLSSTLATPFYYIIQYYFLKKFLGFKYKARKFILGAIIFGVLNALILKPESPLLSIENNLLWFALLCYLCHGNFILKLYAAIVPSTISLLTYITFSSFNYKVSSYISTLKISSKRYFSTFLNKSYYGIYIFSSIFSFIEENL